MCARQRGGNVALPRTTRIWKLGSCDLAGEWGVTATLMSSGAWCAQTFSSNLMTRKPVK